MTLPPDPSRQGAGEHWLVRASTIAILWRCAGALLAALVVLDLLVAKHPHFTIERIPGFGAWFGFIACVVLVLLAKGLGRVFKRPDSYYGD